MSNPDSLACTKCRFYDEHRTAASADDKGLCRFNPPISQPDESSPGLWPIVAGSDWCGHFAPEGAR